MEQTDTHRNHFFPIALSCDNCRKVGFPLLVIIILGVPDKVSIDGQALVIAL